MTPINLKLLPIVLIGFILGFSIIGCGGGKSSDNPTTNPPMSPNPTPGRILFSDSFNDDTSFTNWEKSIQYSPRVDPPTHAYTFVSTPSRLNGKALGFDLRKTDPIIHGANRAELLRPREKQFVERWYAFSIYLPKNYALDQNSAEILAQWHQGIDRDSEGNPIEEALSPPLSLQTLNGKWIIKGYYCTDKISTWDKLVWFSEDGGEWSSSYQDDLGKWTDWVVHVKWGWLPEHNPILEVYKNGQLVFKRTKPNTSNDKDGHVFQIGIYKWDWAKNPGKSTINRRLIYYDEVRIGDGSCHLNDFYPVR